MFELITHFLRFLWFILKDIAFAVELCIGLLLIIVIPLCLGIFSGFWLQQNIIWWMPGWLSGPILGFCFVGVAFIIGAYLDTVWNKARPKKKKKGD